MLPTSLLESIATAPVVAIDTETADPDLREKGPGFIRGNAFVAGISMAWRPEGGELRSEYIPVAHAGGDNVDAREELAEFFRAWDRPVIMANASYDLDGLRSFGVEFTDARIEDVQIREALIDETRRSYSLSTLAKSYLQEDKLSDDLVHKAVHHLGVRAKDAMANVWKLPGAAVAHYARKDAELTLRVYEKQTPILADMGLANVLDLECDLTKVLLAMRWKGVRFDRAGAEALAERLDAELAPDCPLLGTAPQIWAHEWVAAAAAKHGLRGLPIPTGFSFTGPWMEKQDHPFWEALLNARQTDKALTFVTSLLDHAVGDRLHTQYHQTRDPDRGGARSGRLSASNPNLQQVPGRVERLAKPIRQLFLPEHGEDWASCDYSQAEPRITVHYAYLMGLPGAAEARRRYIEDPSTDFHQMVADMSGLPRGPAKSLNLGLCLAEGTAVLTNWGTLPIERVSKLHMVWDGLGWVRHDGLVCSGVKDVITYDGLTGTPDHVVYTQHGPLPLWFAASRLVPLVVSGVAGAPVQHPSTGRAVVYDLLNAGPHHRFTASGRLVSNSYGMGKAKLADTLGVSVEEATTFLARYHAGAPFVRALTEKCKAVASSRGYVKTLLGRRRNFNLWGPRRWAKGIVPKPYAEAVAEFGPGVQRYFLHKALNAIIQGTAADITKKAMVDLHRAGMTPLLTLHDDLPMSVPKGTRGQEVACATKDLMENVIVLSVPQMVNPAVGPNWGEAK